MRITMRVAFRYCSLVDKFKNVTAKSRTKAQLDISRLPSGFEGPLMIISLFVLGMDPGRLGAHRFVEFSLYAFSGLFMYITSRAEDRTTDCNFPPYQFCQRSSAES